MHLMSWKTASVGTSIKADVLAVSWSGACVYAMPRSSQKWTLQQIYLKVTDCEMLRENTANPRAKPYITQASFSMFNV